MIVSMLSRGALLAGTAFAAVPAVAQTQAADPAATPMSASADPASTTAGEGDDIVVTGSRIRRDEFSVSDPITVIGKDEITQAGFASAADAL